MVTNAHVVHRAVSVLVRPTTGNPVKYNARRGPSMERALGCGGRGSIGRVVVYLYRTYIGKKVDHKILIYFDLIWEIIEMTPHLKSKVETTST